MARERPRARRARARDATRDADADGWRPAATLRAASTRGDVVAFAGARAWTFARRRAARALTAGATTAAGAARALSRALGATPRARATTTALAATRDDDARRRDDARDARAFSGRPGDARGVELDAAAYARFLADATTTRRDGDGDGDDDDDARALYGAQIPIANVGDVDVDDALYDARFRAFCDARDARRHCWINGATASTTNAHYDDRDNVLEVLVGAKRVRVFEPSHCAGEKPFGGTCAGADDGNHAGAWRAGDARGDDGDARRRETTHALGPGDALFIPSGWYHEVTSAPYTVAVSHWWRNDFNVALDAVLASGRRSAYHFRRAFDAALDVAVHNETESCRDVVRALAAHALVKNRTVTYGALDAYRARFVPWDDVFAFLTRRGTSLATTENRLELGAGRDRDDAHERTVRAFVVRAWLKDGVDRAVMERYVRAMTPGKNIAAALRHALREAESSASRSPDATGARRALRDHDCIYAHQFDIFWRAATTALESADAASWDALYAAARCEEFPRNEDVVRAVLRNQKYAVAYRAQALLQDNLEDDDVHLSVDVRCRARAGARRRRASSRARATAGSTRRAARNR